MNKEQIGKIVNEHKVVVFMKGNRVFPRCGFSARALGVIQQLGVPYRDVDVLAEPDTMDALEEYSSWPTTPVVYVNKQLIGGSDIALEMFEAGELQALVKAAFAEAPAKA